MWSTNSKQSRGLAGWETRFKLFEKACILSHLQRGLRVNLWLRASSGIISRSVDEQVSTVATDLPLAGTDADNKAFDHGRSQSVSARVEGVTSALVLAFSRTTHASFIDDTRVNKARCTRPFSSQIAASVFSCGREPSEGTCRNGPLGNPRPCDNKLELKMKRNV
ncbi:hypothetical protein RRG08_042591 [Elysia crispata]|uniref:Uncharacterized protein n=1 Tax=Elysia crispata TaxID=231223 RepID=A0AAE0XQ09_9GAST|nr:hypothetical protein RRG08_042591 [Elysia crispata]